MNCIMTKMGDGVLFYGYFSDVHREARNLVRVLMLGLTFFKKIF